MWTEVERCTLFDEKFLKGDLHAKNPNFFLNLFECVDFKNIFYKFIRSSISAGKIFKNCCSFSLLKILRLIGAVYA